MKKALTFDDLQVGDEFETASWRMTRESIIQFAGEFDPQPIHLNEVAARQGPFGKLIASGWHTLSVAMRLMAEAKPLGETPLIGVAVDEIRFLKPVFVDAEIRVLAVVTEKRESSKPGRGYIRMALRVLECQSDEVVLTESWLMLVPRSE